MLIKSENYFSYRFILTVLTMSLLMIKQYVHLRMLQRDAHLDGRLNNIIVKLNKLQALLSAKLEILKLSASILLPLFSLGLLCTLRLPLEK